MAYGRWRHICSHRMRTYVRIDLKLRSQPRSKSVRVVTFTLCRFSPSSAASGVHRIGQDGPEFPYRSLKKYRNTEIYFLCPR
jgi:hypothetical protein